MGCLGGQFGQFRGLTENSLFENASFGSWRERFKSFFSESTLRRVKSSVFGLQDQCFS